MSSTGFSLVIGNYNTSSWSLRAWLVMRLAGLAFDEVRVPLRQEATRDLLLQHSPSGKVPVLEAGDLTVWDSLAIAEFLAEIVPGLWPEDVAKRAIARAVSAEMHSGFTNLRTFMPMDVAGRFGPPGRLLRDVAGDIRRIKALWRTCRERHGGGGDFLFGEFCIADAMMAPVASRFVTYGVELETIIEDYVDSVMAWPAMEEWQEAAAREAEATAKGPLGVTRILREGRRLQDLLGEEAAAPLPVPAPPSPPAPEPAPRPPLPEPAAAPKAPVEPSPPRRNDPPEAKAAVPPMPRPPVRSEPPPAFPEPSRSEPRPAPPPAPPEEKTPAPKPFAPVRSTVEREPPPRTAADAPAPRRRPDAGGERPAPQALPQDDLPDHLRRWRPAGSGIKPIGDGTRRRR